MNKYKAILILIALLIGLNALASHYLTLGVAKEQSRRKRSTQTIMAYQDSIEPHSNVWERLVAIKQYGR